MIDNFGRDWYKFDTYFKTLYRLINTYHLLKYYKGMHTLGDITIINDEMIAL